MVMVLMVAWLLGFVGSSEMVRADRYCIRMLLSGLRGWFCSRKEAIMSCSLRCVLFCHRRVSSFVGRWSFWKVGDR